MWIVFGTRNQTELVPGGMRIERECERCFEHATFYERRLVSTFALYFVPVFDYRHERVMACGACGALFRTDEHGEPDPVTVRGWEKALHDAGGAAQRAIDGALEVFAPTGRGLLGRAAEAIEGLAKPATRVERREPDRDEPPPEDPEKAALLARFAALEEKLKRGS